MAMEGTEQLIWERLNERRQAIREKLECDAGIISTRTERFKILAGQSGKAVKKFLDDLLDPVDITSAFFTNPYFVEILEERRKLAWLPEVLQIIRQRDLIYDRDSDGKQIINCLGLRGVSKSCRDVADSVFFESSFLDPLWYMHIDYAADWREKLFRDRSQFTHWNVNNADVTVLVQSSQVDRALEYFPCQKYASASLFRKLYVDHKSCYQEEDAVNKWPLICSSAKLGQAHRQSLENIWNFEQKLMEFLDVHGSSVWFFVYNPTLLPDKTLYLQLYDLIARMPNLRGLAVLNPKGVYLENNVLHPLPADTTFLFGGSLEYLRCDADMRQINLCKRTNELLINCNIHVKNLKTGKEVAAAGLSLESYANTADFCLYRFNTAYKPPLKSLTLENFSNSRKVYVRMSLLCQVLNRFGDTLTDLTIYTCICCKDCRNKLNLPRLKRLKLWENEFGQMGMVCFDHLLLLKSLEKLRIEMDWHGYSANRPTRRNSVEMEGFQRKLHQSNIWKIFPFLKEVEFRDTCCDHVEARYYTERHSGLIPHRKKEVRYVREGNNVTRFKTRRLGNGFKQTEHKLGSQWGCNIV